MDAKTTSVSVLIPAYNEQLAIVETIERIISVLRMADLRHEVIVIDDGSTDDTLRLAKTTPARIIRHRTNRGYGASLKSGILASSYGTIAIIDADGTYPCEALPEMLQILNKEQADLVIGSRNSSSIHIPWVRKPAKWIISHLAQYIAGQPIADVNSGLRVFTKTSVLPYFNVLSDQFSFTTTQTLAMLCNNYTVLNHSIDYLPRKGKSKIVPWDFINFISLILRLSMLFNPLKVFIPVAFTFFFLSMTKLCFDLFFAIQRIGWEDYSIFIHATISTSSLLFFLTGIQIILIGMVSDGLSRKIEQQNWGKSNRQFEEESNHPDS